MWATIESLCYLLGLISAALVGLLAMWVTFRPPQPRTQWIWMCVFVVLSGVGIAAAIIDHRASERDQSTQFAQLNAKVEESAGLREGFLTLDNIIIRSPTSFLDAGHQFGGNFYAVNKGTTRVFNAIGLTQAYVVDADENTERMVRQAFNKVLQPIKANYAAGKIHGPEVAPGASFFGTTVTRTLTSHDARGLQTGAVLIYFVSWATWQNSHGKRDTAYDCRYLQSWTLPAPYEQKDIVWHYCGQ